MQLAQLADSPVPVWATAIDLEQYQYEAPVDEIDLLKAVGLLKRLPAFRAVSFDRLPVVLTTGIDVEPPAAPIFVDDFEKAWEYGGFPKVMMALDQERLELSYREIPADTPADQVARLMEDYPTRLESRPASSSG